MVKYITGTYNGDTNEGNKTRRKYWRVKNVKKLFPWGMRIWFWGRYIDSCCNNAGLLVQRSCKIIQ
jgi:hypothetical protein